MQRGGRPLVMKVDFTALLPWELGLEDELGEDVDRMVAVLEKYRDHISLLKSLTLADLKKATKQKFKAAYSGFFVTLLQADYHAQLFGTFYDYLKDTLFALSKTSLIQLQRKLKTKYPDVIIASNTKSKARLVDCLCSFIGVSPNLSTPKPTPIQSLSSLLPPQTKSIASTSSSTTTTTVSSFAYSTTSSTMSTADNKSVQSIGQKRKERENTNSTPTISSSQITSTIQLVEETEKFAQYLQQHFLNPWHITHTPIDTKLLMELLSEFQKYLIEHHM
ncbi:hypothetical protein QOT17_022334 [Balamuthia mandrillaris]